MEMATETLVSPCCIVCGNKDKDSFEVLYSHKPSWEIVVCGNCSFTFIPAFYRESVLYEEYKDEETVNLVKKGNNWIKEQRQKLRIKFIRKYIKKGKLLDVGSGWGHFLHAAEKSGFECYGVESDKHASGYAKEELKLKIENVDFFSIPETKDFDIITFWDVLEHIDRADLAVEKCARLTRDGGMLVLQVPQIDSYFAQRQKHKWIHLGIDHVNYFSRKTITMLLEKHGYEVLRIKSSFELKFLLTHSLASRLKKKKQGAQQEPAKTEFFEDNAAPIADGAALFNKFTNVPHWMLWSFVRAHNAIYNLFSFLNIGEEMMVVARKKKQP